MSATRAEMLALVGAGLVFSAAWEARKYDVQLAADLATQSGRIKGAILHQRASAALRKYFRQEYLDGPIPDQHDDPIEIEAAALVDSTTLMILRVFQDGRTLSKVGQRVRRSSSRKGKGGGR